MEKLDLSSYKVFKLVRYGNAAIAYAYKCTGKYIACDVNVRDDVIEKKKYNLKKGDVLYFDKSCKIPRLNLSDTFKRCIKPEKATCLIIPNNFVNIIYLASSSVSIAVNEENKIAIIGDINNFAYLTRDFEYKNLKYNVVTYKYLYEVKSNIYDNIINFDKIAFEKDILAFTQTKEDKIITSDIIESINCLLNSSDKDNIILGLKLLSELDYVNYRNVVKLILSKTYYKWYSYKSKINSQAVKYMFDYIQQNGTSVRLENITKMEFPLIKNYVVSEFNKNAELFLNQIIMNADMFDIDIKFDINLKNDE